MKIRLSQILDDPFAWEESLTAPASAFEGSDLVRVSPVEVTGRVRRLEEESFLLRATFAYTQTLACNRCLADYQADVRDEIELLIQIGAPVPLDGEYELEEEELGLLQLEGDVLDTAPLFLEQVQLNIPMKPLCGVVCKGLCPHCGADLNQGACDCDTEAIDPRWQALAALRTQDQN